MNRDMLSKALGDMDPRYVAQCSRYAPEEAAGPSERIAKMKMKRIVSIALAAALLLALGVAAYAVSSIHAARQQALKAQLQVEEHNVESYIEYETAREEDSDLVILSSVNDGENQRIFINVSPVTEQELSLFPGELSFVWSIDGSELSGFAGPQLRPDRSLSGKEEIRAAVREDSWDAESETLTLLCYVPAQQLHALMTERNRDTITLRAAMYEKDREVRDFGSAEFIPTAEERRVFDLAGAVLLDGEREIELLSLELTPFSAVWRIQYPEAEAAHSAAASAEQQSWLLLEDRVCLASKIFFSDGESFCTGTALTCPFEDGAVSLHCGWGRAIDIREVQRIELDGQTIWKADP